MADLFQLTRIDPVTQKVEPVPAKERIDAILDQPNAKELVQSLDAQSIYALVHEAGIEDAYDLVMMTSGEQSQALLDFDGWTKDTLDLQRYRSWLDVLLQKDDPEFSDFYAKMDFEALIAWLRQSCQVFFWEEDRELLDVIDAPVMSSPDGVYAIALTDEELAPLIRHLLERVYALDVEQGHRILEAVRWEMTAMLEEAAFQNRTNRLGDLGFVPFHEALEVYAVLNVERWLAGAKSKAMSADAEPLVLSSSGKLPPLDQHLQVLELHTQATRPTFFTQCLGALAQAIVPEKLEPVIDSVMAQFRSVVNRAHVADQGAPGEPISTRQSVERAERYLSIGLEMVAGDDTVLGAHALSRLPLKEVHRAGYSATVTLATQANQLLERGNLTLTEASRYSLLEESQQDLLEGLGRTRPILSAISKAPFRRLEQVERTARELSRIAFIELLFFALLRFEKAEVARVVYDAKRTMTPPELVRFRTLFATLMMNHALGRERSLQPLSLADVHKALSTGGDALGTFTDSALKLLSGRVPTDGTLPVLARRYASEVAAWMVDELGDGSPPPIAEVAAQVVLLAR